MEGTEKAITTLSPVCTSASSPSSPSSSHEQAASPPTVITPCAACKILRRRCADKCVLAPYFPPTEPRKFAIAHRVFGASNIIKLLQELPECQRADAVSSMVYEASARIRDPVYGCAGAIGHLQKQVSDLQAQLAKTQAELVSMQAQQANLVALLCMKMAHRSAGDPLLLTSHQHYYQPFNVDTSCFLEDTSLDSAWEPLWA